MKRVTIAYFSWDWQKLLGKRAVNVADAVMADPRAMHGLVVGLARSVVPDAPPDVHGAVGLGEPTDQDLIDGIPRLKAAHAAGMVPKTESWEV